MGSLFIFPFQIYPMGSAFLSLLEPLPELTFELLVGWPVIVSDCSTEKAALAFLCLLHYTKVSFPVMTLKRKF